MGGWWVDGVELAEADWSQIGYRGVLCLRVRGMLVDNRLVLSPSSACS